MWLCYSLCVPSSSSRGVFLLASRYQFLLHLHTPSQPLHVLTDARTATMNSNSTPRSEQMESDYVRGLGVASMPSPREKQALHSQPQNGSWIAVRHHNRQCVPPVHHILSHYSAPSMCSKVFCRLLKMDGDHTRSGYSCSVSNTCDDPAWVMPLTVS